MKQSCQENLHFKAQNVINVSERRSHVIIEKAWRGKCLTLDLPLLIQRFPLVKLNDDEATHEKQTLFLFKTNNKWSIQALGEVFSLLHSFVIANSPGWNATKTTR